MIQWTGTFGQTNDRFTKTNRTSFMVRLVCCTWWCSIWNTAVKKTIYMNHFRAFRGFAHLFVISTFWNDISTWKVQQVNKTNITLYLSLFASGVFSLWFVRKVSACEATFPLLAVASLWKLMTKQIHFHWKTHIHTNASETNLAGLSLSIYETLRQMA